MEEFAFKQERLCQLLGKKKLDALLLNRISSFAWATCGASSFVAYAASEGVASLLITPEHRYLITNNIEAGRLEQEEELGAQGWEFQVQPWYEANDVVARLTSGKKLGADGPVPGTVDLSNDMACLRMNLTPPEGERFRKVGVLCAQAMERVINSIQPGQTEMQIAGRLALESELRGMQPVAIMVAADERIFSYRHPIPKEKILERYGLVILCGRKWGLTCSISRLVHFGSLPDELRRKSESVAEIDADLITNTRPGKTMGDVFAKAQEAYARVGYPDEWRFHHQGGAAGYEAREIVALPGIAEHVVLGQAYAWNPSIRGTKSEDTILVCESGNDILTAIPGWPTHAVEQAGNTVLRPAILEIL